MTDQLGQARPSHLPTSAFSLAKVAKPAPTDTDVPAEVSADAPVTPASSTPAKAKRAPAKRKPAPQAVESAAGGEGEADKADAPVQVSLPMSQYDTLIRYKTESGKTHATILFDAIEATYDQLPELIRARTIQPESSRRLFDRPEAVSIRRDDDEPKKTFIIRVSHKNKATIEQLAKDLGAPNPTQLTAIAYEAYLADK